MLTWRAERGSREREEQGEAVVSGGWERAGYQAVGSPASLDCALQRVLCTRTYCSSHRGPSLFAAVRLTHESRGEGGRDELCAVQPGGLLIPSQK